MSNTPPEPPPGREQPSVWRACAACRLIRRKCPHKTPVLPSPKIETQVSGDPRDGGGPVPTWTGRRKKSITSKSRKRRRHEGDETGEENESSGNEDGEREGKKSEFSSTDTVRSRPARLDAIDPEENRNSRWSSAVPEGRAVGVRSALATVDDDEYGDVIVVRRPAWMLAKMAQLAEAAMPPEPTPPIHLTPPAQTDSSTSMPPPLLSSGKSKGRPRKRSPGTEHLKRRKGRPKKHASTVSNPIAPQVEDEGLELAVDDAELLNGVPHTRLGLALPQIQAGDIENSIVSSISDRSSILSRPASPPVDDAYTETTIDNVELVNGAPPAISDRQVPEASREVNNDRNNPFTNGSREHPLDLDALPPAEQRLEVEAQVPAEAEEDTEELGVELDPEIQVQRDATEQNLPPFIPPQIPFRTSPPPIPPQVMQLIPPEEYSKWRIPGAWAGRFSGPKLYTPLTMHPPMSGLGLVLLSERDGRRRDQQLVYETECYPVSEPDIEVPRTASPEL